MIYILCIVTNMRNILNFFLCYQGYTMGISRVNTCIFLKGKYFIPDSSGRTSSSSGSSYSCSWLCLIFDFAEVVSPSPSLSAPELSPSSSFWGGSSGVGFAPPSVSSSILVNLAKLLESFCVSTNLKSNLKFFSWRI